MMLTCKLCGEMQPAPFIPGLDQAIAQTIGEKPSEDQRRAIEYQGAIMAFTHHVASKHPDYAQLLNQCAQVYLFSLCAKLATSAAPDFDKLQTEGRRVSYWTLAEPFDLAPPIVAP